MQDLVDLSIEPARVRDLDAVNRIVEAAIMTWKLPERVKRLSLPSYRYHADDLNHLDIRLALAASGDLLGIAAWESAEPRDAPDGHRALLLHGIYVDPAMHGSGIGSLLLEDGLDKARTESYRGILVKANRDARGFFTAKGLRPLAVDDPERDYPYRYWMELH